MASESTVKHQDGLHNHAEQESRPPLVGASESAVVAGRDDCESNALREGSDDNGEVVAQEGEQVNGVAVTLLSVQQQDAKDKDDDEAAGRPAESLQGSALGATDAHQSAHLADVDMGDCSKVAAVIKQAVDEDGNEMEDKEQSAKLSDKSLEPDASENKIPQSGDVCYLDNGVLSKDDAGSATGAAIQTEIDNAGYIVEASTVKVIDDKVINQQANSGHSELVDNADVGMQDVERTGDGDVDVVRGDKGDEDDDTRGNGADEYNDIANGGSKVVSTSATQVLDQPRETDDEHGVVVVEDEGDAPSVKDIGVLESDKNEEFNPGMNTVQGSKPVDSTTRTDQLDAADDADSEGHIDDTDEESIDDDSDQDGSRKHGYKKRERELAEDDDDDGHDDKSEDDKSDSDDDSGHDSEDTESDSDASVGDDRKQSAGKIHDRDSENKSEDDSESEDDREKDEEAGNEDSEGNEKDEGMSAYEKMRLERIQRNKEYLANLGLDSINMKKSNRPKQQQKRPDSKEVERRSSLSRRSKSRMTNYAIPMRINSIKDISVVSKSKGDTAGLEKESSTRDDEKQRKWKKKKTYNDRVDLSIYVEFQRLAAHKKQAVKEASKLVKMAEKELKHWKRVEERMSRKSQVSEDVERLKEEARQRDREMAAFGKSYKEAVREIDGRMNELVEAARKYDAVYNVSMRSEWLTTSKCDLWLVSVSCLFSP
jgi:hypothetical protein